MGNDDLGVGEQLAIAAGKTDDEVLAHLTDRYGDFVRYKPPLKASTWLLWAGPALLFVLGLGLLVRLVRQRAHLPDEAFDEEPRDDA
jgi:cytochrome c-type biogenesis protein CcmH